ncbi:MAG TPA: hypothetical protein VGF44_05255 [Terriglobales bacterium]|jgi:hypothetical protein
MTNNPNKNTNAGSDEETKRHQKEQQSINNPSVEESNEKSGSMLRKPTQGNHDVERDEKENQNQGQRRAS